MLGTLVSDAPANMRSMCTQCSRVSASAFVCVVTHVCIVLCELSAHELQREPVSISVCVCCVCVCVCVCACACVRACVCVCGSSSMWG